MGLRINTNVISLISQRNLGRTSKGLNRALERLSSGFRINSAKDDAAGLAISEGLTSQVRGLRQAVRNANDGIGFLATAEGALAEGTSIAQRIRELGIQAANGTLSGADRGYLNDEVQNLLSEFERISNETDFNGVKLLDGSFATTDLQVGIQKGRTISFAIGDARTSQIGSVATVSSSYGGIDPAGSETLTINGESISGFASDGVSYSGGTYSAIAVARAINANSGLTGVDAYVAENYREVHVDFVADFTGTIAAGDLKINNVNITGSGITDNDGLIAAINEVKNTTGVTAEAGSDGAHIKLTASDGRNIVLQLNNISATEFDHVWNVFDASAATYIYNEGLFEGISNLTGTTGVSNVSSVNSVNTVLTGRVELESSDAFSLGGTNFSSILGCTDTSVSVDTTRALNTVDITTQANAADALRVMDATMKQLSELRAGLGATQNRLESTISNLSTVMENVAAANSQIKDTDVAAETAELTRNQILQQAGISVLGQANLSTQVALALLRF
jgi:flagellin